MSSVLWYSTVAFQCRKVGKVTRSNRGLFSFLAKRFFASVNVAAAEETFVGWNICSEFLGRFWILSMRFWLMRHMPGLLPFSGSFMITSLFCASMFSHFSRRISPIRL